MKLAGSTLRFLCCAATALAVLLPPLSAHADPVRKRVQAVNVKKTAKGGSHVDGKRSAVPLQLKAGRASAPHRVAYHSAHAAELRSSVPSRVDGSLGLKSNAVMVLDQQTHEVLFDRNAQAVLPIASLTKLMTSMVLTDAQLPLDESITITEADVDTLKGSSSRLAVGTTLSRGEMLHLALMSSENRAAHALGRTFPGGLDRFVELMNAKAKTLGMGSTRYVDPTGLSPENRSSAKDLAALVAAAYERPLIRELSTSPSYDVDVGHRTIQYRNTNRLVSNPNWDIGLQKTGYIAEAGRCLVMQATVAGRQLIMVFLDSAGKFTRTADAERVRRWIETR
jgi:D-alanyl-D-alanine endopeptidase (penicillin-binding protein 7)